MKIQFDLNSLDDYRRFLKVKSLPRYKIQGRTAEFPDEYAKLLDIDLPDDIHDEYSPSPFLWDYQAAVSRIAIRKRKFALFVECALGKSMIYFEYIRHVAKVLPPGQAILIIDPLMVVGQMVREASRFYGEELPIERVKSSDLSSWLTSGTARIGITNYEALKPEVPQGRLGCLVLDEAGMLKSMYGKWGQECIRLGAGLRWKLAGTGTPAPNDRIEFANHAVFLDAFPTVNSFLAKYFINRGQTDNRWEIKRHAVGAFYRDLSHWSIFLSNPATYGWKDNCGGLPPIVVHTHDVELTQAQEEVSFLKDGYIFPVKMGGVASRSVLSQIAKGNNRGKPIETLKNDFVRNLVMSEPGRPTIIWCKYNPEQEVMAKMFPDAANISGATPYDQRETLIEDFQAGRRKILISKPKILGLGLNLQVATRHVWSGLQDSYEEFWQGTKRSNRPGSTETLDVHIPLTSLERPMADTVMAKADRIREDTAIQEREFRNNILELGTI